MGEMLSHQYDLEYLLVHELIHSLGFGQDLVLHHPAPLPSRLSPAFDSHPLTDPSASFTRFSHPSIWNRFTQLNSTPLVTYKHVLDAAVADVIAQGELRPAPAPSSNLNVRYYRPADVYLALAGHVRGSRAMRDMYDLATTNGSLVFDTGAWPATPTPTATGTGTKAIRVELETGLVPFAKASSAGHIRIGGAGGGGHVNGTAMDQDGLMGWQLKRGVKVSSVGIGQRTRSVLGALGYTLMGQAWVTRRGVAKVDVDEVQRMRQDALAVESQRNMSCGGAGVRDAAAWAGAFGVVVAWIVHRGWV
ncbi:hypothetical protein BCR44DRAFT_38402 [Catenaria anguillulae PL171]|uniref:Uncharacterized protein n=1 Tax=Catenaria anguillulae PL171 TaxID=765915 RepID=A0A1Y2HPD6_9FUNG|nr:hypothetical protein BCR44DRAFT_38402 [Catenaria anguillulae PL171]